jgi:hypothetical protein
MATIQREPEALAREATMATIQREPEALAREAAIGSGSRNNIVE